VITVVGAAYAQQVDFGSVLDDRHARALEQNGKLRLSLTLDRQEYLAGESIYATISASNTTGETIEVFDPLRPGNAVLEPRRWASRSGREDFQPGSIVPGELACCRSPHPQAPLVILGPGQTIERRFVPHRSPCSGCENFNWTTTPPSPGRYQFSYCFSHTSLGCAHAEFTVVVPILRQDATLRFMEPTRETGRDGMVREYGRFVHAFLLEYNGKRYVGVQRSWTSASGVPVSVGVPLVNGDARRLELYDRVAETTLSADSLHLSADALENLNITWVENGQIRSYCTDKDRTRIDPCPPANVADRVAVSVSPNNVSVVTGASQRFKSTVKNHSNSAVTWSIHPNVGSISSDGRYTAPAHIASQQTVTVTASSVAAPARSATASITLLPTISVSMAPAIANLSEGQGQQFTATVANASTQYVSWDINPEIGFIDSSGIYQAPARIHEAKTITLTARSVVDPQRTATAAINLVPFVIAISPRNITLNPGQTAQFTAAVTGITNPAVTWSVDRNLGSVSSSGLYTAPASLAQRDAVTIFATSVADPTRRDAAVVTVNAGGNGTPPAVGTATSVSGSGLARILETTFTDTNGYQDIAEARMLVQSSTAEAASCLMKWQKSDNTFYLRNDANTQWEPVPANGSALNSQCALSASPSSAAGAGNTLTVRWAVSFRSSFAGPRNVYLAATDSGGLTSGDWQNKAALTLALTGLPPISDNIVLPSQTGTSQTVTFVAKSPDGFPHVKWIFGAIGAYRYQDGCRFVYIVDTNELLIYNDPANGYEPLVLSPGTPGTEGSSQCSFNAGASSVRRSFDAVELSLNVTLDPSYIGPHPLAMNVFDHTLPQQLESGWTGFGGTWTAYPVQPVAPAVLAVNGAGTSGNVTMEASSVNGYRYVTRMELLINGTDTPAGGCNILVQRHDYNAIYLLDDTGYTSTAPADFGAPSVLDNGRCRIDAAASTLTPVGANGIRATLAVTFYPAFAGAKTTWIKATDYSELVSTRVQGSWNIQ
jgi:hypothetical protein